MTTRDWTTAQKNINQSSNRVIWEFSMASSRWTARASGAAAWWRNVTAGRNPIDLLAVLVLITMVVLVWMTFEHYGISWDEDVQNTYGKKLLSFYLTGFTDRSAFEFDNLYLYGGSFDLLAAVVNQFSPFGEFETRHFLGGLVGILGLAGVWRLGRLMGGPVTGFLSLLLLALTPAYYGHMFINPKDIPFACGMTWTVYLMCRAASELPRVPLGRVLMLGAVLGATMGTRIGGILAGIYLAVALLLHLGMVWRANGGQKAACDFGLIVKSFLPMLPVLYLVMAVLWPWSWQSPLNPVKALAIFSHFPWPGSVLVDGQMIKATDLPAYYLPMFLSIQLPELVLVGLLIAGALGLITVVRRSRNLSHTALLQYTLLVLAAGFPLLYFIVERPVALNGMRHFLFMVAPTTVLAALALHHAGHRVAQAWPRWRWALPLPVAATAVVQIWTMVGLHPNEYIFYNQLVGGVAGAQGRFELDYWGTSLAEAVTDLEDRLKAENGGKLPSKRFRVMVCAHPRSVMYFLPPQFILTHKRSEGDFFLSLNLSDCPQSVDGKPIIQVSRFGAPLSIVKDRRELIGHSVAGIGKLR
jgi:hypothetical protein